MVTDLDDPVVLRVADFGLPETAELPGGVLKLDNVLLSPGGNGLHDSSGRPIPESCLRRGFALELYPHGRPEPLAPASLRLAPSAERLERVVYLPYARMAHFGHLLTELAGNVGELLDHPRGVVGMAGERSIVVVPARFHASIAALAELLKLPSRRVMSTAALSGMTWADEAVIPRPSMINRHGLSSRHFGHVCHVLDRIYGIGPRLAALTAVTGRGKLYLSRSRLSPGMRRVRDEEALERELERLAWRVVHPQELPLAGQLEALATAHTVAGCVGSALHLLMAFGESVRGRRLIALGEGVERTNPNVVLQAARQRMPFRHVVCMVAGSVQGDEASPNEDLKFTTSPVRVARCVDALASGPLE